VVKSKLVRALNEKLPEHQLGDVELAVNCLLKHMADAPWSKVNALKSGALVVLIYIIDRPVLPVILKQVKLLTYWQR
jgi:hypothetical protein